jgi:hypothetical protein
MALIDLSGKLHTVAAGAQRQELKQALEDVANEFNKLGQGLTRQAAVRNFDTTELEALFQRVSELCGP